MPSIRLLALAPIILASASSCARPGEFAAAELVSTGDFKANYSGAAERGSIYQAGSIAKYACTLLALRYSDRGLLELERPLGSFFPELDLGEAKTPTISQLLANRSGLRDGLLPAVEADMTRVMAIRSADKALMEFSSGDLKYPAGGEYSYDLVNWMAIQAVLERVGGDTIEQLLTREVLEPAGMTQSFVFDKTLGAEAQPPVGDAQPMPDFLKCAGGLAAVPNDLVRLLRFAHKGGLSAQSVQELKTIRTPEENYSLGGRFETHAGRLIDWKTGSNGPYKSVVVYDPVTDTGFAAMTASDTWDRIEEAREEWLSRLE